MHERIKYRLDETLGIQSVLEKPKEKKFGHFALPTFAWAKEWKKNPNQIAQEFALKLKDLSEISSISVVGGYVNFSLSNQFLEQIAQEFASNIANPKPQKQESILLEYVSANPTGPLHIGHARGAIFGDVLARIGRYLGYPITTEYYINDAGVQIENLGLSIYFAIRELLFNEANEFPEGCYRGEYIFELAKDALKTLGEEFFKNTSKAQQISTLSLFGKDKMLQEIQSNLAKIGINFDNYVSEKELFVRWENVLGVLKSHQGVYESEGKIWLKSSQYGDEKDRVIVRENGEPTYLAGDIIYHQDKFLRSFKKYINIWGADHHGYIARVKAAIEFLGFESKNLEVLLSQMVSLLKGGQSYKMSKRAGNFILMKDVIDEVGADALRLVFLSKKADTHLEFDIEVLNKQDSSNPVYYIHYAHARIHTLFSKSCYDFESVKEVSLEGLSEILRDLLVLALSLPKVLEDAFIQRAPQKVVEYLRLLSSEFHHFYNEQKILNTKEEAQILRVLLIVAKSLECGLGLLGVRAKTSM